MRTAIVLTRLPGEDACDPAPELVLAQRPGPAQVMEAAGILGPWPGTSYLAGEISLSLPA